jgi:SAM-dependent methyltransferase
MSSARQNKDSSVAELYDVWHEPRAVGEKTANCLWHLLALKYLPDVTGLRVLEVGCGVGEFTRLLAERGADVVGADISRFAVEETRREVDGFPSATAAVADICALPFASESFDLVVSLETIEHSPSPRTARAELVRVLRRGGKLILTHPNYFDFIGLYRFAKWIGGREFTEAGQPINKWTTSAGSVWHLKWLGCRIEAVDGTFFKFPIPYGGIFDMSWIDRPHAAAKWIAHHALIVARKR